MPAAADTEIDAGHAHYRVDHLRMRICPDRQTLRVAAARAVAMRQALAQHDQVAMAFATAPSPNEFLAALASAE